MRLCLPLVVALGVIRTAVALTCNLPEASQPPLVVCDVTSAFPGSPTNTTFTLLSPPVGFELSPLGSPFLTSTTVLDHEVAPSFSITVERLVNGTSPLQEVVSVEVGDVPEPPQFVPADLGVSVAEAAALSFEVGAVSAGDPDDGDAVQSYTAVAGSGLPWFSVGSVDGSITVTAPLDHEATPVLTLIVTAVDGTGLSTNTTVTITVTDSPESPVWGPAPTALSLDEHSPEDSLVAVVPSTSLVATDPDTGQTSTLAFSVVGTTYIKVASAASASAPCAGGSPCGLYAGGVVDYDAGTHQVPFSLVAEDATGLRTPLNLTLDVNDINQAPVWPPPGAVSVPENATVPVDLAALVATDPDVDTLTYSLASDDGGPFLVSPSGVLTLNASLDFETTPSYTVVVTATEVSNALGTTLLHANTSIPISVLDVNDAPTITVVPTIGTVPESSSPVSDLGSFVATDADGDDVTFDTVSPPGPFTVAPSGVVSLTDSLDFEDVSSWEVTVEAVDARGLRSAPASVTILVGNDPEESVTTCTNELLQIGEGSTGLVNIESATGTDPDGDVLRWDFESWADGVTPLGYMAVTDDGAGTFTATLNVTVPQEPFLGTIGVIQPCDATACYNQPCSLLIRVTDINDPPQLTLPSLTVSVMENATAGTVVARLTADDVDTNQTLTFSFVDGGPTVPGAVTTLQDLGLFVVEAVSPRAANLVLTAPRLDFESQQEYVLSLTVQDDGITTDNANAGVREDTATLTVTVVDVPDVPVIVAVSGGSSIGLTTAGSEFVFVDGYHFGSADAPSVLPWVDGERQLNLNVAYWDSVWQGGPVPVFTAMDCVVLQGPDAATSAGRIRCLSVPGYGYASSWSVSVSGQVAATFQEAASVALRYINPSVASFASPGADLANTSGGQVVELTGTQFGTVSANAITSVTYGPADAPAKYTADDCSVVEDHTRIWCRTVAGVGNQLRWAVTIGNLTSETPTTNYAPPEVVAVFGPGATDATTEGGQTFFVNGTNFGAASEGDAVDFVQYMAPGGGTAFVATGCEVSVDHVQLRCLTASGVGEGLTLQVSVAGQVNPPTTAALSYGPPSISSVVVVNEDEALPGVDPEGGSRAEVLGANFGVAGDADILFNGDVSTSPVYVDHGKMQFTVPAGATAGDVVIRVGSRDSNPATVAYARPVISAVQWLDGGADEPVTLDLRVANLGFQCGAACGNVSLCDAGAAVPTGVTCTHCRGAVPEVAVTTPGTSFPCAVMCLQDGVRLDPVVRCVTTQPVAQANLTVTTGALTSSPYAINYVDLLPVPELFEESAEPASAPSVGAMVTFQGAALGRFGSVEVTNDAGTVTIQPEAYTDTEVSFLLPPGQGRVSVVVRVLNSTTGTDPVVYRYRMPVVLGVTPGSDVSAGGAVLTVFGTDLGVDLTARALVPGAKVNAVTLGTRPCTPIVSWAASEVQCVAPAGFGGNHTVVVSVSQLCNSIGCSLDSERQVDASNASVKFSYEPPRVLLVSPDHGPTLGKTVVTISGRSLAGLGFAGADEYALSLSDGDATVSLTPTSSNHTHATVVVDDGSGPGWTLSITVGGQTHTLADAWSYDRPVLRHITPRNRHNGTSLAPCPDNATLCVADWAPAHYALLRIDGANFGSTPKNARLDSAEVRVGGQRCFPVGDSSLYMNDSRLECEVGPMPVGSKSVTVKIADQESDVLPASAGFEALCDVGWHGNPGELCVECPAEGGVCDGGGAPARAAAGFWMIPGPNATSAVFQPCRPAAACTGDNTCAEGYIGAQCSACKPGTHVREQFGDGCTQCPAAAGAMLGAFVIGGILGACVFYKLYKNGPSVAALGIALDYFQIVAVFAALDLGWPDSLMTVFRVASLTTANIDSTSPECSVSVDYVQKWYFAMGLPVFLAVSMALAYFAKVLVAAVKRMVTPAAQRRPVKLKGYATLVGAYLAGLNILYIFLLQKALEVFQCTTVGTETVLTADPNVPCNGETYDTMKQWSYVSVAVYGAGVPALFSFLLFRYRFKIKADQHLRMQGLSNSMANPHYFLQKRLRRLYFKFGPSTYYWVLIILARKLLVVCVAAGAKNEPLFAATATTLVLFGSYVLHVRFKPYRKQTMGMDDVEMKDGGKKVKLKWHSAYNELESTFLTCGILLLLGGIMYHSASGFDSPVFRPFLEWVLLLIVVTSTALCLYSVGAEMVISVKYFMSASRKSKALKKEKRAAAKATARRMMSIAVRGTAANPVSPNGRPLSRSSVLKRAVTRVQSKRRMSGATASIVKTVSPWNVTVRVLGVSGFAGVPDGARLRIKFRAGHVKSEVLVINEPNVTKFQQASTSLAAFDVANDVLHMLGHYKSSSKPLGTVSIRLAEIMADGLVAWVPVLDHNMSSTGSISVDISLARMGGTVAEWLPTQQAHPEAKQKPGSGTELAFVTNPLQQGGHVPKAAPEPTQPRPRRRGLTFARKAVPCGAAGGSSTEVPSPAGGSTVVENPLHQGAPPGTVMTSNPVHQVSPLAEPTHHGLQVVSSPSGRFHRRGTMLVLGSTTRELRGRHSSMPEVSTPSTGVPPVHRRTASSPTAPGGLGSRGDRIARLQAHNHDV